MFEVPEDKQETKKIRLLIGASAVVVLLILVGVYFAIQPEDTEVSAAPAACTPDPVKDLKIVTAKASKDTSGMWAVWTVQIANRSAACTYTNVEYETTYVRNDDTVTLVNKGTLDGTFAPGDEHRFPEIRDVLFPADAAFYRFKVTGAQVAQ